METLNKKIKISSAVGLQVNNIVYNKHGEYHFISHTDISKFGHPDMGGDYGFYAIELSPEILEKCGFSKRTWGKQDIWDKYGDSYAIIHIDTNYVLHRSWEKEPDWCMGMEYTDACKEEDNYKSYHFCWGIKYLHQLQNLYFALTGEELPITL